MHTRVQDDVFVFASNNEALLADGAERTHQALAALLNDRFSRPPSAAVTVYLLADDMNFAALCNERLGHGKCGPWLGVWIKESREILVNQGPGRTSLVHELVHPLIVADAGDAAGADAGSAGSRVPRWLREGVSSLYELPVIQGREIHGATNWRLDDLHAALASPTDRELAHLDALFRMPDDLFDGEHARAAYAVARFACQYWDSPEQDKLWKFWRAFRDRGASDPTGEKSFAAVFGQTPREADAAWQKWVRTLHRAG
jgi:hypothetical protein